MPSRQNAAETEALQLITENIDTLKILLSGSKDDKPLKYRFKGKKGTKTIFMSIKLQYLINEYCIENDVKIGDIAETAIVEYLSRHGCSDKLAEIIDTTKNAGEQGGIP